MKFQVVPLGVRFCLAAQTAGKPGQGAQNEQICLQGATVLDRLH
jgi:hypothetical protein